ncbi:DUF2063 domain-containing protein [Leptospira fletcheri]|uniref:DUF2063 domain-containing protein n=1 Tax=Leptospira fletcheri TaxID=2484981 RepID=A0A4R9GKB5_9LEPT|nr:DNA-binding domain-containing protein [Leptospira fletcheri]TGK12863.1 DUF2063 domain-containing protein [Leptospira fletcheri]
MSNIFEFRRNFAVSLLSEGWTIELDPEILPAGTLDSFSALNVYSLGYGARLTEALGETYETVWRVLGDETFFEACQEFIKRNDSKSYNLSDYGKEFPSFLGASFPEIPFVRELAEFERIIAFLFHLPPVFAVDLTEKIAGKSPGDLRFVFSESCIFLRNEFSVRELWKNRNLEFQDLSNVKEEERLLLGKKGEEFRIESLNESEWALGTKLKEGKTLLEALNESEFLPSDANFVSVFVSKLVQGGFIQDIRIF